MHWRPMFLLALSLLSVSSYVHAANFTFDYGTAGQCDDFSISWKGGMAPFELTLVPVFGVPQVVPIPQSSFSNGVGSFEVPLSFPQNQSMLAVMSDASGFASGGVSDLFKIGPQNGISQCNTTLETTSFDFDTPSALTQCRTYTFDGYTEAVQPVTIYVMVPGGDSFILQPPEGSTSFDWITDVVAGTSLVFDMVDSEGRPGGSSQVDIVGLSDDATCLTGQFPSSLAIIPSATNSRTSSSQSSTLAGTSLASASRSSSSIGTIAGAVVGGLLGLSAVGLLAFFLLRRKQRRHVDDGHYAYRTKRRQDSVDLIHDVDEPAPAHVQPYPLFNNSEAVIAEGRILPHGSDYTNTFMRTSSHHSSEDFPIPNPYGASTILRPASLFDDGSIITYPPRPLGSHPLSSQGRSSPSSSRRKAGAPAAIAPARFVLHTDAEEVIELPPQYSERLAPPKLSLTTEDSSTSPPHTSSQSSTLPPATPTSRILEDDICSDGILQVPMSPGPPSSALSPRPAPHP